MNREEALKFTNSNVIALVDALFDASADQCLPPRAHKATEEFSQWQIRR